MPTPVSDDIHLERVRKIREQHSFATLEALGIVLAEGMERVTQIEQVVGTEGFDHKYVTSFPMPDGSEWEIEVKRK